MPSFTMIPPRGDHPVHGHFWIPIDDENCWAWSFDYHPIRELTAGRSAAMRDGKGIHVRYVPGTFRPLANKDNDYLMDRAAQKAGSTFSGVEGIAMQDASLQESMGPIVDRTKENLVSTDNGIIMARHRLLRAAKALVDKGSRRRASIPRTRRCARPRSCCRKGAGGPRGVRGGPLPHRRAELQAARHQDHRARPAERAGGQAARAGDLESGELLHRLLGVLARRAGAPAASR